MPNNVLSFILIYAVGVIALLYIFIVLPGKRKNKQVRAMHAELQVGDEIATLGGIIGKVIEKNNETVTLLIDEETGSKMRIVLMAVQTILNKKQN